MNRLHLERELAASRELVFEALTEEQHLSSWWKVSEAHTPTFASVDLTVGGRYRIGVLAPSGTEFIVGGEFQEIVRPSRLVYTWQWEHTANEGQMPSLVTIDLQSLAPNLTRLVLVHERFIEPETRDQHHDGWVGVLSFLEEHLSRQS